MITITCRSGAVYQGSDLATIILRNFGSRAFFRASQNSNSPEAGMIIRRTRNPREYKVLEEVNLIERDV